MKVKETDLVRACIQWLELRGIVAWRNNTGAMRATHNGRTRFVRFSKPGVSDIIGFLPDGRFLAVECKVGRNKPTRMQQIFLNDVEKNGGVAVLAYTLDDLIDAIDNEIGEGVAA